MPLLLFHVIQPVEPLPLSPERSVVRVELYEMARHLAGVETLEVELLFDKPVPGWHGKGAWTSQGRLVIANNGEQAAGGFARRFRDGSDQVRHFAWAFRMFAASDNYDLTARLLHMKEEQDAKARKTALNAADIALNAAARRIVVRVLRKGAGVKPIEASSWIRFIGEALLE